MGTAYGRVACWDGESGAVTVLPLHDGAGDVPAIVSYAGAGTLHAGPEAEAELGRLPGDRLFPLVKRLLGRRYDDPEVRRQRSDVAYELAGARNGDVRVRVARRNFSPAELTAHLLERLRDLAGDHLGEPVAGVVVGVPASYDGLQRQALSDAVRIAGLPLLEMVSAPVAAAVARMAEDASNRRLAVYDLGAGKFDFALVEIDDGVARVAAFGGDGFLGGQDFDQRVLGHVSDLHFSAHGAELRRDRGPHPVVARIVEKAKRDLSVLSEVTFEVPVTGQGAETQFGGGRGASSMFSVTLTRERLEELVRDLVDRSLWGCEATLQEVGWSLDSVDEVLLVGGQARMPLVEATVAEFFGRAPRRLAAGGASEPAVASGLALRAAALAGVELPRSARMVEVAAQSLSVETAAGALSRIVPKGTPLPARGVQLVSTAAANQTQISLHVVSGDRELAADNRSLARVQITGLRPAPRATPRIEIGFEVDGRGLFRAWAVDRESGEAKNVRLRAAGGLTEAEIQHLATTHAARRDGLAATPPPLPSELVEVASSDGAGDLSLGGDLPGSDGMAGDGAGSELVGGEMPPSDLDGTPSPLPSVASAPLILGAHPLSGTPGPEGR